MWLKKVTNQIYLISMAEKKETKTKSVFETLNSIDVSEYTEKKGNLTYLSWAWAWAKVKENYPDATYKIYENAQGLIYHTDGKTCWVKTSVTIDGIENTEYLPVMDNRNNSIPLANITSRNVNDSIQRSLTKACARHGLGLYIYAGEDLPEVVTNEKKQQQAQQVQVVVGEAQYKAEIAACASMDALMAVWQKYPQMQQDKGFRDAWAARRGQVEKK